MWIKRPALQSRVRGLLRTYPVVALLGARQVGKTSLARRLARQLGRAHHFDLENPDEAARLQEPMPTLSRLKGLIVLDEVQRHPGLFEVLRVLADRRPSPARFLVLGSAAPALLKQSSESLAGRIAFVEVPPLQLREVGAARQEALWERGGFPLSLLARTPAASFEWRQNFRQTFLERDVPNLELPSTPPAAALGRLWAMLAHVHGELLNWSELGRSLGVSDATVRRYVDVLEGTYLVRQLKPWHENISKRQVKAPKLYFRDSGLLHLQLGLRTLEDVLAHPRLGASWEGFAIEQLINQAKLAPDEMFFWRTQHGAELDLLVVRGARKIGFEIKRTTSPSITPSMRSAIDDLKLEHLFVVHAGEHEFSLGKAVTALPLGKALRQID